MLIRGIRGGFVGHEFHEKDHCDLDAIGLKYIISQSLTAGCEAAAIVEEVEEEMTLSSLAPVCASGALSTEAAALRVSLNDSSMPVLGRHAPRR